VLALPIVMTLAAVVLAQAPQATKSESLAELYGRTLGAAAQCQEIAPQRLDNAAALASARIKALAANDAERAAAGAALATAVARGSRDVQSGATTCAQAESELGNLEHELAARR
jgi:hypothetical protein